jgi:hypothetical protein
MEFVKHVLTILVVDMMIIMYALNVQMDMDFLFPINAKKAVTSLIVNYANLITVMYKIAKYFMILYL